MNSNPSTTPSSQPSPPACDPILALVQGELSSKKRYLYRGLLLVISVALAALLSLWLTEPGPLPARLHLGFAALATICVGWICVLSWILMTSCPTALDRVATASMATIACVIFLLVAIPIGFIRGDLQVVLTLLAIGLPMLLAAALLLRNALRLRRQLEQQLHQMGRGPSVN